MGRLNGPGPQNTSRWAVLQDEWDFKTVLDEEGFRGFRVGVGKLAGRRSGDDLPRGDVGLDVGMV